MFYFLPDLKTKEPRMIVEILDNGVSYIPMDELNSDYKRYLQWVEGGNTASEYLGENHD